LPSIVGSLAGSSTTGFAGAGFAEGAWASEERYDLSPRAGTASCDRDGRHGSVLLDRDVGRRGAGAP
jgi:hypothetical protein